MKVLPAEHLIILRRIAAAPGDGWIEQKQQAEPDEKLRTLDTREYTRILVMAEIAKAIDDILEKRPA
ncbi:hypothetical protein ACIQ9R_05815 [Streptomyces sp. NPDC094447]|uniref:hypothetical protein n=1 Tax=Streptomyces sp. NPDC094447 TaxID=3366062 RepID=UPI0037FB5315